jgi:hypothetical protein
MSKLCAVDGCDKAASSRGLTCGPEHAHAYRYKKPAAVVIDESEKREQNGDDLAISLGATRICTLDQLVEHCRVDLKTWQVDRFVANKWEVGAKNSETSKIEVEPLFQVKAWFKRKVNIVQALNEIDALRKAAEAFSPKRFASISRPRNLYGNFAEIGIPDIHIGKLAWGAETGYGNYDVNIGLETYEKAMDTLVDRVSRYDLDEQIFVIGNDLFHTDSRQNMTTGGTHVDTDSRYHKTFERVRELLCRKLEEYRSISRIRLVIVPGNHDEQTSWHLGDSLRCWFRNCKDVVIDNDPSPRKWYQNGKVMLMWCHGNKGKKSNYPLLMATERPDMFGATKYREIHTGHLHQTRVEETHGVRVRILPSLCESDYWHSENGFTGNIKAAEAFIWNKEEGLIGTANYCL